MMTSDHDNNGNTLSNNNNNNNNNNNKMTSRKVIITRKASISDDSPAEENNNLSMTLNSCSKGSVVFSVDGVANRCYSGGNVTTVLKPTLQQQQQQHLDLISPPPAKFRRFLSPPPPNDCGVFTQGQSNKISFFLKKKCFWREREIFRFRLLKFQGWSLMVVETRMALIGV